MACGIGSFAAMAEDQARGRNFQREAQKGGEQQKGREGGKIQRAFKEQRHHQHQHRGGDGDGQPHIQNKGGQRQDKDGQQKHYAQCQPDIVPGTAARQGRAFHPPLRRVPAAWVSRREPDANLRRAAAVLSASLPAAAFLTELPSAVSKNHVSFCVSGSTACGGVCNGPSCCAPEPDSALQSHACALPLQLSSSVIQGQKMVLPVRPLPPWVLRRVGYG